MLFAETVEADHVSLAIGGGGGVVLVFIEIGIVIGVALEPVVVIASQETIRLQTTCKTSDVRWKANGDGPATSWMRRNASAQPGRQ